MQHLFFSPWLNYLWFCELLIKDAYIRFKFLKLSVKLFVFGLFGLVYSRNILYFITNHIFYRIYNLRSFGQSFIFIFQFFYAMIQSLNFNILQWVILLQFLNFLFEFCHILLIWIFSLYIFVLFHRSLPV